MRLLFDLDGTITDSSIGIARCIQYALSEAGSAAPPLHDLTRYVGPPLAGSFSVLLNTSEPRQIEEAIAAYRRRFEAVGMFENTLYPGMAEMLAECALLGHSMSVVTSKPRPYALRILQHFGLGSLFRGVHGPELGDRHYTKASLIREACAEGLAGDAVAMIGDRAEDVLGARSNGITSVAVTWGYGSEEELRRAAPDRLVASVVELGAFINTEE